MKRDLKRRATAVAAFAAVLLPIHLGPARVESNLSLQVDEPALRPTLPAAIVPWVVAAVPAEPRPAGRVADLTEISWTVTEPKSLAQLSWTWSISRRRLAALNPALDPTHPLPVGTKVRVHDGTQGRPTRSVGAPNRGRLIHGVPMPEGDAWQMKPGRQRVYGTLETVRALQDVLTAYGETFPGARPIPVRDLSALRGGKISPHKSHQTGRDVDLGFALLPDPAAPRRVNEETFDHDKNWFLVRTLIDRGDVQAIYTSGHAIRWLRAAAEKELPAEELSRYFDLISYERGHGHHMHVRFRCPTGHRACLDRSKQAPRARPKTRPAA